MQAVTSGAAAPPVNTHKAEGGVHERHRRSHRCAQACPGSSLETASHAATHAYPTFFHVSTPVRTPSSVQHGLLPGRDRHPQPDPHRPRQALRRIRPPGRQRRHELQKKQPSLGWVSDKDGHPTPPFSIAARLILPVHTERDNTGTCLFAEYPSAQLFARLWAAVVGLMDLSADNIFREVELAASVPNSGCDR